MRKRTTRMKMMMAMGNEGSASTLDEVTVLCSS